VPDAPSLDLDRVAQRIESIALEHEKLRQKGAPRRSEENLAREVERVLRRSGSPRDPDAGCLNRNRCLEKAGYQNYVLLHTSI